MKSGPPVSAPSLPVVTTTRMPLLVPCSTVPYHFSTTLSPKAKASFSNSSFRVVTASSRYPVSVCAGREGWMSADAPNKARQRSESSSLHCHLTQPNAFDSFGCRGERQYTSRIDACRIMTR